MARLRNPNVEIDPAKIKAILQDNDCTLVDASKRMGHSGSYLSTRCTLRNMPAGQVRLFCTLFGKKPNDIAPTKPIPAKTPAEAATAYSLDLDVTRTRCLLKISIDGTPLYSAYAAIKDNTETALMRSIAEAAQLCYRFAQQKDFQREG